MSTTINNYNPQQNSPETCCRNCLLWQDKISSVARQDACCGKTRSLLWQDKISLVARHKGIHKGGRREAPPPFVEAAEGRLLYVLPQERSCLATTEILSCHNTHLVLPQQRSCLATTDIVSSWTFFFGPFGPFWDPWPLILFFWDPLGPFGTLRP